MNSEARAAVALLIYSATLTLAMIMAIAHVASHTITSLLAFGVLATLVWMVGPAILRGLSSGKH